ncbi:hypothetical protein [Nostoc sp. FACHB-190]|uniref:hypothetical protein n=1 Tax=Nostoc sp. FACHB-190 TaxID=2692838 RepID=UPI00168520D9|nr:hypothetical protein [Nostoc sp. FACHB-190]MBD2303574.1 hypothetical protein [Nostoc sp. FACHB-190]
MLSKTAMLKLTLKQAFSFLLLGGLSIQLSSSFPVQAQTIVSSTIICGTFAPAGKVATRYLYTQSCRPSWDTSIATTPNSSVIQSPVSGLTICGTRPPTGYFAVMQVVRSECNIYPSSPSYSSYVSYNAIVIAKN